MEHENIIDFNGELTGEAKKFLLRRQVKTQLLISLIVFFIWGPVITLVALSWDSGLLCFHLMFVVMFVFSALPPSKSAQKTFMPIRVFVDLDDELIVYKSKKSEVIRTFDTLKKIIDYGDWYYIEFYFPSKNQYFVCQKDLLAHGTLENFEKLFFKKLEYKTMR